VSLSFPAKPAIESTPPAITKVGMEITGWYGDKSFALPDIVPPLPEESDGEIGLKFKFPSDPGLEDPPFVPLLGA